MVLGENTLAFLNLLVRVFLALLLLYFGFINITVKKGLVFGTLGIQLEIFLDHPNETQIPIDRRTGGIQEV